MILHLNQRALAHAEKLIAEGRAALDERDEWSQHRPSSEEERQLIDERGWGEYEKWYLAIDESEDEETKARYKFPYGDYQQIHRCAVLSAEARAAQYHHRDV